MLANMEQMKEKQIQSDCDREEAVVDRENADHE